MRRLSMNKKVILPLLFALSLTSLTSCNDEPAQSGTTVDKPTSNYDPDADPFVTKVDVKSSPDKLSYFEGEKIDLTGLRFDAAWIINGEKELITDMIGDDLDSYSPSGELKASDKELVCTIGGFNFSFDITVQTKEVGDIFLTLADGEFFDGTKTMKMNEGDSLPSIKLEGKEGWYFFDEKGEIHYFYEDSEFVMPSYSITLYPIIFDQQMSCLPRFSSNNTWYPVYSREEGGPVQAGDFDNTSEGLSDNRVKYTVFPIASGNGIVGNNGIHLKNNATFFVKFKFTFAEGDPLDFNFYIDDNGNQLLRKDNIMISQDNPSYEYLTYNDYLRMDVSKSFVMEFNEAISVNTSFYLECQLADIVKE